MPVSGSPCCRRQDMSSHTLERASRKVLNIKPILLAAMSSTALSLVTPAFVGNQVHSSTISSGIADRSSPHLDGASNVGACVNVRSSAPACFHDRPIYAPKDETCSAITRRR